MWNPYEDISKNKSRAFGVASVIVVLVVWALLTGLEILSVAQFPSPWAFVNTFIQLSWDSNTGESPLFEATLWSVGRVFLAAVLVVIIGVPVGVVMGASPKINALLSPLLDPFRSAPVVAFTPIFVMWFGLGEQSKIYFLFFGAVVFLVPMVRDAIKAVPQSYWVSARDLGATEWESVYHAVLPMAKPRIADAIIVAVSLEWTYITVAEFVNAQVGLGQIISQGRRMSSMPHVFVGIFVIIAIALVTYTLMTTIKRKLYPWETE